VGTLPAHHVVLKMRNSLAAPRASMSGGAGLKGKRSSLLSTFQGRGSLVPDAGSPGGGQPATSQEGGRASVRPRPGEIEVPRPDAGTLGSPAIGVRVAPGESARKVLSQGAGTAGPRGESAPAAQRASQVDSMEDRTLGAARVSQSPVQNAMGLQPSGPSARPEQVSGGVGHALQPEMQGLGPPMQPSGRALSPRGGSSYGGKTGLGQQGRKSYDAADRISAMSTVSALSVSEDSFQPKNRSTVNKARVSGYNPITGAPRSESVPPGTREEASSPGTGKRYASARSDEEAKPHRSDLAWAKNGGHYGRTPINFDKGVRRNNPFAMNPNKESASPDVTPKAPPKGMEKFRGLDMKLALRNPPIHDYPHPLGRSAEDDGQKLSQAFSTPVDGEACAGKCSPAQILSFRNAADPVHESTQARESIAWTGEPVDSSCDDEYYKFYYGRSMTTGRGKPGTNDRSYSGPCRQGDDEGVPLTDGQKGTKRNQRSKEQPLFLEKKHLKGVHDWAKDESTGAIVPGLSDQTIRQNEKGAGHMEHVLRKGVGEFAAGPSDFTNRLSAKACHAQFRIEFNDKKAQERPGPASVPSSPNRRNCILGENLVDPSAAAPPSPGFADCPAGMSTFHIAHAASVSSGLVAFEKPPSGQIDSSRKYDHGESGAMASKAMTALLSHSPEKDMARIRMYREACDRPFVELCSAFKSINDVQMKDSQRIRAQVNNPGPHNVSSLLQHSQPRSVSCEPEMQRTLKPRSKESSVSLMRSGGSSPAGKSPAGAGMSARSPKSPGIDRQSHGRSNSLSSVNTRDALNWGC